MNLERVGRAIRILKKAPSGKFSLMTWAKFTSKEMEDFVQAKRKPILNGCGTTGCAIGWLASNKTCRAEGLHLGIDWWHREAVPLFDDAEGYEAVQAYFDFGSYTTSEYLFSPNHYENKEFRKPTAVIDRLETLLAAGEDTFLEMCRDTYEVGV